MEKKWMSVTSKKKNANVAKRCWQWIKGIFKSSSSADETSELDGPGTPPTDPPGGGTR